MLSISCVMRICISKRSCVGAWGVLILRGLFGEEEGCVDGWIGGWVEWSSGGLVGDREEGGMTD